MSDTYQAIYNAVRSRISGGDIGSVVESAIRQSFDVSFAVEGVAHEFERAAYEQQRPSAIYRPSISIDGNQWCALYGDNLQDGVAGFGDSPEAAMQDFDSQWQKKLESKPASAAFNQMFGVMNFPSIRTSSHE